MVKVGNRTFYRTKFTLEVLSEKPIPAWACLGYVLRECEDGDYVGHEERGKGKVLGGIGAARALTEFGSEPGFFQLNEDGSDASDLDTVEG